MFQDVTIETLNQTITEQWQQIDALARQVAALNERLQEAEASAPGPANEPPPHQVGPQAPAVATVISDVDIYDVPGGNGKIIGILRSGRQVKLATDNGLPAAPGQTCKPKDWCHVVIPELPGGSGWVWDEFLKF